MKITDALKQSNSSIKSTKVKLKSVFIKKTNTLIRFSFTCFLYNLLKSVICAKVFSTYLKNLIS